jgi:hypothetical protein
VTKVVDKIDVTSGIRGLIKFESGFFRHRKSPRGDESEEWVMS